MTTPTLLLTPRRPALLAGHDNDLDVLVRIQAPDAPVHAPRRNPLHLSIVVDRSGSMSGHPLAEAKRCAEFILDQLQPTDRLSVVAFDSEVVTLSPAMPLEDKERVRHAIRSIDTGGCTNLHGGWLRGAETLASHTNESITSRVLLLSDGCANAGLTDNAEVFAQCAGLARAGVSTSTYGLGEGFNEELMIGMARHGQGRSYYGQAADDLMDPFREEFALLDALCARRLRLEVRAAPGIRARMLNDYPLTEAADAWQLPDLAYGGEAWAMIRLRIPSPALRATSPAIGRGEAAPSPALRATSPASGRGEAAPSPALRATSPASGRGEIAPSPALRATSPASGRGEIAPSPAPAGEGWGEGLQSLASFAVSCTGLDGTVHDLGVQSLALPALPASAFNAIAEDDLVVRRAGELEAAVLQTQARAAARRRDWTAVGAALKSAERIAAHNPWVADSLTELKSLAALKDEERFAKESAYAANRMSTRLASRAELASVAAQGEVPAFLRRKSSQGKAEKPAR